MVLNKLKKYNAKATFFCIGDNIKKNSHLFLNIISEEHSIGNHTYNHLEGWKTQNEKYFENTKPCQTEIEKHHVKTNLFRPPYGKIKLSQSKVLRKLGYKIIMWDIISYDFNLSTAPKECLDNVLNNVKSGSIAVFHDSEKAFENLKFVLLNVLENLKERGFVLEKIT